AASGASSPRSMWPLGKIQLPGSFFDETSRTEMSPSPGPSTRNTIPPACATAPNALPILDAGGRRRLRLALVDQPLELLVVEVDDVDPHLQHVVHAPLAEAHPHVGIGVPPIGGRVVVDADHVQ